MSVFSNLDAVLDELGRLGLRADAYLRDEDGNPGVVVIGRDRNAGSTRTFSAAEWDLRDREKALEWAHVIAAMARGVDA